FTAQVTDGTGASATSATTSCTLVINPPVQITCPPGTAFVNAAYTGSVMVTGGSGQFSYSIVTGSLPSGLTLNAATGAITGTPTQAGPASFAIQVKDASTGTSATSNCTITVYVKPTLTCMPAVTSVIGIPYNSSMVVADGSG